ncbi:hypothetical protein ACFX1S_028469 [Malus domestica]
MQSETAKRLDCAILVRIIDAHTRISIVATRNTIAVPLFFWLLSQQTHPGFNFRSRILLSESDPLLYVSLVFFPAVVVFGSRIYFLGRPVRYFGVGKSRRVGKASMAINSCRFLAQNRGVLCSGKFWGLGSWCLVCLCWNIFFFCFLYLCKQRNNFVSSPTLHVVGTYLKSRLHY